MVRSLRKAVWEFDDTSRSGAHAIAANGVPLRVSVALYIDGNLRVARTSHIWQGGLGITTREPLDVGTELEVEFFLPGGFDVHSAAVVSRHRVARQVDGTEHLVGIDLELLDLDTWAQKAIRDHVAARVS